MSAESVEQFIGSSGEVALWRAVIDQLLHDATNGSVDPDAAREFFWRSNPDLALICDFADLEPSALCKYALIAAGSDIGNVGTFQGNSIHREMALYVEAGLSPWAALRSATTTTGQFLGVPVGVKPGDLASLVLLSDSPIEDIENTEKIVAMIHRGKIVDREALLRE